ncbi:MAG TPA: DNA repair protein RadC, partial [Patescibacteria group bacterium]|nr:DNA repair protein RadC [Patescibacteria group bacterium]
MPVKNLHKIEQPRERLEKYGPGKLSDAELLAIILRTGPTGIGVMELSKKVLKDYKGASLANAGVKDLLKIKGLGEAKACEIAAVFELGRRLLKDKQAVLILSPREVWERLKDIRESKKEHFIVFFLNTQNQEIEREIISVGTLNASLIHPREVFEPAVKCLASHIIVAHNHPSGSLEPSDEDVNVTKRLCDSGRLLGIEVLDHVLVTGGGY